uniref:Zinc finger family protein n=1 Tax=Populus alba TaxID=43335 RepID=A0A4U5PZK7_POPAL|nr:zinc finger family protein [Populus alba]
MRCHPERQWRGINPPPNYRRPVSPIQPVSIVSPTNWEDMMTAEDHEVASCLLMLADSDGAAMLNVMILGGGALGGHRASHKNVKGCFALTRSDGCEVVEDHSGSGDVKENVDDNSKALLVLGHKCSICLRMFSSGQALGGHMRCHWEKGEENSSSMNQGLHFLTAKEGCGLDLNLPAPMEDESSSSYSSGLTLDLRLCL